MADMYDLFRQAQGGAAFDAVARAYGMSPEQMRAATAALTPAFAQGFQRQAQSGDAGARFAALFQTETYARAFDAQAAALDPAARTAGDDALGALFGSKDVSRAVAAQAAAVSGVQAEIIRKVLPVLASIIVGGLMKAAQGAGTGSGGGAPQASDPLGQITDFWRKMTGGAGGAAGGGGQGGQNPHNPFQDWMRGGAQPDGGAAAQPSNPMGDMMAETLNAMFGGVRTPQGETASPAGPGNDARPGASGASPLDDMVATGRATASQNARAMEQIFEAFFGKKAG